MSVFFNKTPDTGENGDQLILSLTSSRAVMDYQIEMIANNDIPGLLRFRYLIADGKPYFYYDIRGYVKLRDYIGLNGQSIRFLAETLMDISVTIGSLDKFLLEEKCLLLRSDMIYINPLRKGVKLVYLPAEPPEDLQTSFSGLVLDLVGDFHPEDATGKLYCRRIIEEVKKTGFRYEAFTDFLMDILCFSDGYAGDVNADNEHGAGVYNNKPHNDNAGVRKTSVDTKNRAGGFAGFFRSIKTRFNSAGNKANTAAENAGDKEDPWLLPALTAVAVAVVYFLICSVIPKDLPDATTYGSAVLIVAIGTELFLLRHFAVKNSAEPVNYTTKKTRKGEFANAVQAASAIFTASAVNVGSIEEPGLTDLWSESVESPTSGTTLGDTPTSEQQDSDAHDGELSVTETQEKGHTAAAACINERKDPGGQIEIPHIFDAYIGKLFADELTVSDKQACEPLIPVSHYDGVFETASEVSACKTTVGDMFTGKTTVCDTSAGDTPADDTLASDTPAGGTPAGGTPADVMSVVTRLFENDALSPAEPGCYVAADAIAPREAVHAPAYKTGMPDRLTIFGAGTRTAAGGPPAAVSSPITSNAPFGSNSGSLANDPLGGPPAAVSSPITSNAPSGNNSGSLANDPLGGPPAAVSTPSIVGDPLADAESMLTAGDPSDAPRGNLHGIPPPDDPHTEILTFAREVGATLFVKGMMREFGVALNDDRFTIGRKKEHADLVLDNMAVGKTHAMIIKENEKWYLKDLSSKNGTFLNNIKLERGGQKPLGNSELITVANVDILFTRLH